MDNFIDPEVYIFDKLDSTNLEAARISKFISKPRWILAFDQIGGFGRYGKDWQSSFGDFSGSLIFFPKGSNLEFAQRGFSTALSLKDTLIEFEVPSDIITFKWPNDVMLNEKKLAGILLQTTPSKCSNNGLIVGIGVNLVNMGKSNVFHPYSNYVTSLSEYVKPPNPRKFLDKLIRKFNSWEKSFREHGFNEIKINWEIYGPEIGRKIGIRSGNKTIYGKYLGLSNLGELISDVDGKTKVFSSAEVYF